MGLGMSRKREMQRQTREREPYSALQKGPDSSANKAALELVFSKEYSGRCRFELEEMLAASAEVLGKGSYGNSYKGSLSSSGATIVVKRLKADAMKEVTITKLEQLVGTIRHQNIVPLNAYCYSKDETLLVYDYYVESVSSLLQGRGGTDLANLDWTSRLNIAIGAARAIGHIHKQNGANNFHGNIKPSNIFLNSEGYGCVSDVGLANLIPGIRPLTITNYRAPEVLIHNIETQASDVYSFGVLLLQLLIRRFEPATSEGEVNDFVQWGRSVSKVVESGDVFDGPLRDPELLEVLKETFDIGIQCAQKTPHRRPKMSDVVTKLEQIHEKSTTKNQATVGSK